MTNDKKTRQNKTEKVLSYYDEEKSRNENSASRENAGPELDVCTRKTSRTFEINSIVV